MAKLILICFQFSHEGCRIFAYRELRANDAFMEIVNFMSSEKCHNLIIYIKKERGGNAPGNQNSKLGLNILFIKLNLISCFELHPG